jgi:uncharacterized protein YbjT (DUF2867 family)
MKILVCGANGFIGRHLLSALRQAGHECVAGVRKPSQQGDLKIDYTLDTDPGTWLPRLAGIDVVVNAIGVLRDTRKQPMAMLHAEAPAALFRACRSAGVKKIIHISALGVGTDIDTAYFRTKLVAEKVLSEFTDMPDCLILRPSVVYGPDGASAAMFRLQARMPLHTLPMGGRQMLQPVHVDDIAAACVMWLASGRGSQTVAAVGADAVSMREMLDSYRHQLGHREALHVPVPGVFVSLAARIGDWLPMSPLSTENLRMLEAGSTADKAGFAGLLGREPRSVHTFLQNAGSDQTSAK